MGKSKNDLLAIAFLILLVTLFFGKEIFTDSTLVTFRLSRFYPWLSEASDAELTRPSLNADCALSYYPRRVFATRMMGQGDIPFWNPHQFSGTPFLANFQSAVFYPVNLFLYLFDPAVQMDLFIYIHFMIAAIFGYLLARKLRLSEWASLLSGLSFTFCGFMVTRYGQPTFISTASWLPAVLFFGEHLIESPSIRRAGLLSLVLCFCVLAGFPQLVLLILYSLVGYVVIRIVLAGAKSPRTRLITLLLLIVSIGVASLACAFQLLPTYELGNFSYRKVLPYEMILTSGHRAIESLKYLIPDILGHPLEIGAINMALDRADGPGFTHHYPATTGYVGILPVLLALVALSRPIRRMVPFIVLAAISLLLVFGTGLLSFFYHNAPGFNFSRIDRAILVYMLCVSILAGYGFDLSRSGRPKHRVLGVALGFAAFAVILVIWLKMSGFSMILRKTGHVVSEESYLGYVWGKAHLFLLFACLASLLITLRAVWRLKGAIFVALGLMILLLDLVPRALPFKISQSREGLIPRNLFLENLRRDDGLWRIAKLGADVLPSNTATLMEVDDVHGYDALNVNHYLETLDALDGEMMSMSDIPLKRRIGPMRTREALESRLLDLLNVKYVLMLSAEEGSRGEPVAVLNTDFLPRAFLVERAHFFDSYDDVLAYMRTDRFDPGREVLLRGEPSLAIEGTSTQESGTVEILDYGPNGLTARVEAGKPCYLVVSDVFYPGWKGLVDDEEETMLRADYAFRALRIPPGTHEVTMTYRPLLFRIGLLLSMAGIALIAAMVMSKRSRPLRFRE